MKVLVSAVFLFILLVAGGAVASAAEVVLPAAVPPVLPLSQTGCSGGFCLYPVVVTGSVADTGFTCENSGNSLTMDGTIVEQWVARGCGYWFDLSNIPLAHRQFITGETSSDGIVGYRYVATAYTHNQGQGWSAGAAAAALASGSVLFPNSEGGSVLTGYPQTYCRYWGASTSYINYDSQCQNTTRIGFSVATQGYNMWPVYGGGHGSYTNNIHWEGQLYWVVRGEPEEACDTELAWNFTSPGLTPLGPWSAFGYSRSGSVGHDAIGSLWWSAYTASSNTTLTQQELQLALGTSGLVASDGVELTAWYRGLTDGGGTNTIQAAIFYIDGSNDSVTVNAVNTWTQLSLTADNGKHINAVRFYSASNRSLTHWIDDIVLSVPCDNYDPGDVTPTPTPVPTGTPAPTTTPIPPTPIPNPGGDPIPAPGSGPVRGCYVCNKPARLSVSFFGQWIVYLACVIWNIFSCSVRIWFLEVGNWIAGVWQTLLALVMWLPTGLQFIMDWGAGVFDDFVSFGLDIWNQFRAGFTAVPQQLVQMVMQSEVIQALWRFATWLTGLWIAVKTLFQALLSATRNIYDAVLGFIHMLISLANAVRTAWVTPAYEIDFIPGQGGNSETFQLSELEEAGPNTTKIYWLIIMAMAAFDQVLSGSGLNYIQFIAIGILSLILIAWTLHQWRDIFPV